MLDDTLLLTVCGLMIVIRTSCAQCHTTIHIQAYTYNHAMMLHTGGMKIPLKSCAHPWSLSDPWSLRLPPVPFTRMMVESLVSAPATWQLTRLILKMMVSAPATCGVQVVKGLVVRSLDSASATCAVYQTDG